MPHLVGQKYERLLALQDQPGPLQDKHLKMRLEGMMSFHDLRTMLCHGEMTIGLLANGDWMIGLEILCCEKGEAVSRSLALTRVQAETLAAHLAKASNALVLRIFAGITRPVGVFKSSSELFNKPSKEESSSVEWEAPVISVAERLRCRCVGSLS